MINKIKFLDKYRKDFFNKNRIGLYFFMAGIFFLPSAFVFSALFFLISVIISLLNKKEHYFNDFWNYPLLLIGTLILISSIFNIRNDLPYVEIINFSFSQSFLDLVNWIPFFLFFWTFSDYLKTRKLRKISSLFFLAGSIPVLVTGFGQYLFNWNGPFEFMNGLIVWYQRPIQASEGITGLFNNSNYLGCWLSIILPFAIASINTKNKLSLQNIFSLSFLLSITTAIILTKSRSAWGSLVLSIPLMLGTNSLIWFIPIMLIITVLIAFTVIPNVYPDLQLFMQSIIPNELWKEFSPEEFNVSTRELRINIWLYALKLIKLKPYLGYAPGLFPLIYVIYNENSVGHTHNIFLELAFNYGIPVSLIFLSFLVLLLYKSLKKIKLQKLSKGFQSTLIDKAWWASSFILSGTQLVDVQYYDGKISIAFWILLSGLRSIIKDNE